MMVSSLLGVSDSGADFRSSMTCSTVSASSAGCSLIAMVSSDD